MVAPLRAALVLFVPLLPLSAQSRPSAAAIRRAGPIVIDGRLDESAWAAAVPATDFVQQSPVEGAKAEFATEVRFLFDDDAIYVAARMFDPEPQTIARQLVRRDQQGVADQIGVGFDPRLDKRTSYVFYVTAAGVQRDFYIYNGDEIDLAWDAVWASAVQIDLLGWTAEFRIPLSQMRYETTGAEQTWGMDVVRNRIRSNEETHFSLMSTLQKGYVPQFGTLTGLRTTRTARRVEFRPYAVAGGDFEPATPGDPFRDGSVAIVRAGLDLKYGLGSSFTLDATLNPDFGQVESDPAVINLTAFETFQEERRPFFVEDARIFDFALAGGRNVLFYGRRIGRRPSGAAPDTADFSELPEAARIVGAAKLTGRTSRGLSVGAIGAVTDEVSGRAYFAGTDETHSFRAEPRALHGAVRVRQDLADGESNFGAIATLQSRQLPSDGSFDFLPSTAFTLGADWEHQWAERTYAFVGYVATSQVRGDSTAMLRIQRSSTHFLQRPDATRLRVDSSATSLAGVDWRIRLEKRRGAHWTGSAWLAEVTPTFDVNDLGFSNRQEVLDAGAELVYREITPGEVFRSYRLSGFTYQNWTHEALDEALSARSWGRAHVGGMVELQANATLLNYWELETQVAYRPEMADRNSTRGGPMMLQPRSGQWSAQVRTDDRRRLVLQTSLEVERRAMGAGRREEIGFEVQLRPSSRVELAFEPKFERSRSGAQYVGRSSALSYAPTFGSRYIFADLERREVGVETRLNVTFSPRMTLQLFAQPLISSGDFVTYKQLTQPRSYAFDTFLEGSWSAGGGAPFCSGGRTCLGPDGTRLIDFDGNGTSDHSFTDRDFNIRSLLGNAVFRWEYRPGSTLFLVWQRQQEEEAMVGDFSFGRDARALFGAQARNVFLVKVSYWVGL